MRNIKVDESYVWLNGKKLSVSECATYNQYTDEIKRAKGDNKQKLLDLRHKFLVRCLEMNNDK